MFLSDIVFDFLSADLTRKKPKLTEFP